MNRTAEELATFLGGRFIGNPGELVESVAELDSAGPGDLTYAEPRFIDRVGASGASCVLVSETDLADGDLNGKTLIVVSNPKAAFARAAEWIEPTPRPDPGVHPTAIIGRDVMLGDGVYVGAYVVIEDDVVVGADTSIYPGCYIASGCRIGSECVIHANSVFYSGVEIGDRVTIHAGGVVGSDGFGYVRDGDEYLKFPQRGRLLIQDDVEIGANSTVDRGSLGTTTIESGTKLDNLVHVAHNVRIGSRTVIAAQTGISGSCDIGDDAVIAGQVGIADHVRIDSGAIVGAQCGIPSGKRIRAGKVFWGTPARPLEQIKIQHAHISRLPKMAAELARLRGLVDQIIGEQDKSD
jgi:UDP-3-O-[3-hydroxymyristoyl] glucosamine N-acyltransferase